MVAVQGPLAHAQHRLRAVSSSEPYRRLVDDGEYVDGSDLLRVVRRSLDNYHPVVRYVTTTLQRQGIRESADDADGHRYTSRWIGITNIHAICSQ